MLKKIYLLLLLLISLLFPACADDGDPVAAFTSQGRLRVTLQWPQSNQTHIWLDSANLSIVGDGIDKTVIRKFEHLHYRPDEYIDFELPQGTKTVQIELKNKAGQIMVTKATDVNLRPGRAEQVRFRIKAITEEELKRLEEAKKKQEGVAAEANKVEEFDQYTPFYRKAFHYLKGYVKDFVLKWVRPEEEDAEPVETTTPTPTETASP